MESHKDNCCICQDMIKEMERQLHEQYAINNNSNLSSIIALLVTLMAAVGFFGLVFIRSTNSWSGLDELYILNKGYSLTSLYFITVAVIVVLCIMMYLCVYQGVSQRCEQFITDAIRRKYKMHENDCVLLEEYSPYNKKGLQIIQGLYGEIVKILIFVGCVIIFVSLWKMYYSKNCICECVGSCTLLFFPFIILIITVSLLFCKCNELFRKYYDKQDKYKRKYGI